MWHVYILQCADDTYYTGIAIDVTKRVGTHNLGRGAKYTRSRLPVTLVHSETAEDKSAALRREIVIKSLSRREKTKLIESSAVV
ncbi:MAG: GIY-YIG nuclease family protein [Gammaproteobacteria bacterium]|jgi:putative endonuclease|nr:GIY-YIG nuclease family protein [Gammaproteobacteria bacterium]